MIAQPDLETAAMNLLLESAEHVIAAGVQHARVDDPHRFATMPSEFDGGRARRRLQVDYLGDGRVDVSLLLLGQQGGEERAAVLFTTIVQAVAPGNAEGAL